MRYLSFCYLFGCRGKGDYHRLGHGSDDHVRWPKQVTELSGKHIVEIACGSLHCVAVSKNNDVYTWGDNDEGQLGDGTTNAIQRPKLVTALQGMTSKSTANLLHVHNHIHQHDHFKHHLSLPIIE